VSEQFGPLESRMNRTLFRAVSSVKGGTIPAISGVQSVSFPSGLECPLILISFGSGGFRVEVGRWEGETREERRHGSCASLDHVLDSP